MRLMGDTHRNVASDRWVLSTNQPYRRVGSLWLVNGVLFTVHSILLFSLYMWFPASFLAGMFGGPAFLLGVMAIYSFAGGFFLHHDSRTICQDPFPDGSTCPEHPGQPAYDACAICGALRCPQDLVRILQSLRFSPGMFAFDGVACRRCARRRVKALLTISTGLLCVSLPVILVSAVGLFTLLPPPLAALSVTILGVILLSLLLFGVWSWRRGWWVVTTPLSEQPALMMPTSSRLAQKAMVGDSIRFKRIADLST